MTVRRGQALLREYQLDQGGHIVIEALGRMSVRAPVAGVPGGAKFGEGSMQRSEARHYDVVALRDSHMAFMPRATFNWLLDTSFAPSIASWPTS